MTEQEREQSIRAQVAEAEKACGLTAELPAKTLAEVVNLSEYPTVMVGEFDELFLAVPKEIIVDAMLVHQRYFPLFNADGSLANKFLITSNGNPEFEANIVDGNQRVVAARLTTPSSSTTKTSRLRWSSYVQHLDEVVFQEKLGTTLAKTKRIVKLVEHLCAAAGLEGQEKADALRAAYLCKADLVTGAVVEFTSVQGIMGSYYAKAAGETDVVAERHRRPLPSSSSSGRRHPRDPRGQGRRVRRQARYDLRPVRGRSGSDGLFRPVRPAPQRPRHRGRCRPAMTATHVELVPRSTPLRPHTPPTASN